MKLYLLSGTIPANSPWSKVTELMIPSGENWSVSEIRILSTSNEVRFRLIIRIGASAETIAESSFHIANAQKLPYPVSFSAPAGSIIVLEAANPTATTQTLYIELIYETGR